MSFNFIMPKGQSKSSGKYNIDKALGISPNWHTGFAGYLEKFQAEWESLEQDKVQQFLRDRWDGLIAWCDKHHILKPLPDRQDIKSVRPPKLRFFPIC